MEEEIIKTEIYFQTPIYLANIPQWVKPINKISDRYIKKAINNNKKLIKEREKLYKKKINDFGLTHHSEPMFLDPEMKTFTDYVSGFSHKLLDHQGFDMSSYNLIWNELWVQEFSKKGGGYHNNHIHSNNHISGFYFLKCSEKTSYPIFHDPRPTKLMTQLKQKDESQATLSSEKINFKILPGTLIVFNSYLTHEFVMDAGIEPFRFIHFNLQAIPKI
jgi:uncharacterized protein (TIGR02466 family)